MKRGANPSKGAFGRCVRAVSAKGGAVDPRAVCAAAGRRKYGKQKFAAMAKAGKRRAAKKNSSSEEKALSKAVKKVMAYLPPVVAFGAATEILGSVSGLTKRKRRAAKRNAGARANPVDAAIEAFEDFHGEAPKEIIEFESERHEHGVTSAVGELVKLKIRLPRDRQVEGGRVVTLRGFKRAFLTMNERKTQLFIEGGDQSLDLEVFGISMPHEVEHLGECIEVVYFTTKKHLGRDGGTANYVHRFGGERGEPRTPRPQMIYRVLDEVIEFAGGGYTLPKEGIDG